MAVIVPTLIMNHFAEPVGHRPVGVIAPNFQKHRFKAWVLYNVFTALKGNLDPLYSRITWV